MSSEWGRIDANGTVYVRTSDGEREIGSWQAGDATAGLAFYQLRYADLSAEVALLAKRLAAGSSDPAATKNQALTLRAQLSTVAAIGDLSALDTRLGEVIEVAEAKAIEHAEALKQVRAEAIAKKEALVAEAEQLAASSTAWKVAGDRLREIGDEWGSIRGADRKTDEQLWRQFTTARDGFGKRRGTHFSQLDAERGAAQAAKERLIERAVALSASSDWRDTATALRELMVEWKAAGRTSRETEDALWAKFRAAQDVFFSRRAEVFAERDKELVGNLEAKQAIIAEAEQLEITNPKTAQNTLRELQARFDAVGHVPRDSMHSVDAAMRAAEQRVRDAVDAEWRQSTLESNPFRTALLARLAEAEAKLARAEAAGDTKRIAKAQAEVAQRRALLPDLGQGATE